MMAVSPFRRKDCDTSMVGTGRQTVDTGTREREGRVCARACENLENLSVGVNVNGREKAWQKILWRTAP